jgi:hypothetical protein
MSVKKGWCSVVITLLICACGWCKTELLQPEKDGYQEKSVKVFQKDQSRRVTRTGQSDRSVYKQLDQIVDISALTLNTTFSDAIEILRNLTDPPIDIVVLWRDLSENAAVEQDTPIYIEGVPRIPLRNGLEILLRAVSSGLDELDYVVEGGVIIIGTKDSLPAKMVVRVYDISYLAARPATYAFNFGAGFLRGWPVGANRGIVGPGVVGNIRGRRAYGRRVRRGTRRVRRTPDGGTVTIRGQSYGFLTESRRVREQNEIPQLVKHAIKPETWRWFGRSLK